MDLGIDGKLAIVAGGSRGCGLAIAQSLAAEGASVFLSGRDPKNVESAVSAIKDKGGKVAGIATDMVGEDGARRIVEAATENFGAPAILVVNPPSASQKRVFDEISDAEFQQANDIWVLSLVRLSRLVLPAMKEAGWGRIVYMGSTGMKMPHLDDPMYAQNVRVAAAAVIKTLAHEYGRYGITANTIAPGPFMSGLTLDYSASAGLDRDWPLQATAGKRWGQPEEMGPIVAFLCSNQSSFITGETIRVDSNYSHNLF